MYYAVLILLVLSSPLSGSYKNQLALLLDQNKEAQAYWKDLTQKGVRTFLKRPPHDWFNKNWEGTVAYHLTILKMQEKELLELLAQEFDNTSKKSIASIKQVGRKYRKSLMLHGMPSHLSRKWLSYAATSAVIAAIIAYFHHFAQTHTLFILDPSAPSLFSALEDSAPFLGHDYINYNGTQYFQVKKEQEPLAKSFLAHRNISYTQNKASVVLTWYNEAGDTKIKEFLYKYGINPIREIIKILKNESPSKMQLLTTDVQHEKEKFEAQLVSFINHAANVPETAPLVKKILQNRSATTLSFQEKRTLYTDIYNELAQKAPQAIEDVLTLFGKVGTDATRLTQIPALQEVEKGVSKSLNLSKEMEKSLSTMPAASEPYKPAWYDVGPVADAHEILHETKSFFHKTAPEIQKTLSTTNQILTSVNQELIPQIEQIADRSNHVLATVDGVLTHLAQSSKQHPDLGSLVAEMLILRALHLNLQANVGLHEVAKIAEQSRLTMEISSMIPLFIATFLTYKTTTLAYQKYAVEPFIKILKHDLLHLQLILNKERDVRNTEQLSQKHKGCVVYWTTRLKRYQPAMPQQYKSSYRRYRKMLESKSLSPEQKMTIIECIFKDYEFLHK